MSESSGSTPTVRRVGSSLRTTCCGVRIKHEPRCKGCEREVLPLALEARREHARHMESILDRLAHLAIHGDAEDVPEVDRLFSELDEGKAVGAVLTTTSLAAMLDGRHYGAEITPVEAMAAKKAGLVVVFGYSDYIKAKWCADTGAAWTFDVPWPHATFKVFEDAELFCVGVVFALADVRTGEHDAR